MSDKYETAIQEINDRLVRIESRLVQLMYFLGASPYHRYTDVVDAEVVEKYKPPEGG